MNIKIYTTPTCSWCQKVKEYLKSKKISFKELDVSTDARARKEMIEKTGQMAVPVIQIGDNIIVGFNQSAIDAALV